MKTTPLLVSALFAVFLCGCTSQRPDVAAPNVDAMIRAYGAETDGTARAATLERLALTRDPRAAVALGEALDDSDLDVRVAATAGLMWHFMPEPVGGGTEQHMLAASAFWKAHGEEYRQRAAALGPRQIRQIETGPDGRPSPIVRPARLVPVIVELTAPGNPYKAESPIMLTITIRNRSSATIHVVGWGLSPTDWNAETANIDLTDIYNSKRQINLYLARPQTVPPPEISGQSVRAIPPGGELSITFDARKWRIEGGWQPGLYRVKASMRGILLDDYTSAMIATNESVVEIDKPR